MTSTEEVLRVARRLNAAIENRDYDEIATVVDPHLIHLRKGLENTFPSLIPKDVKPRNAADAFRIAIEAIHANFEEWRCVVDQEIVEGDTVVFRQRIVARYRFRVKGSQVERPAFEFPMVVIFKVSEGRVAQVWAIGDELGFLQGLGLPLPALARASQG